MALPPSTRASLRFSALELATIAPTVLLWVFVMHAAELGSALLLYAVRVACTSILWWATIRPVRAWEQHGRTLDDAEVMAIDEALAAAAPRFMRQHGAILVAQVSSSTIVGLLAHRHAIQLGGAELACMVLMGVAILVVVRVMQYWLWQPFDDVRMQLGTMLHARKLEVRRLPSKLDRGLLMLGTGTTLGIFLGCFGMGWLVNVVGMRATAEATLRNEVLLAAQEQHNEQKPSLADVRLLDASELPEPLEGDDKLRSLVVITPWRTTVTAAAAIGDGRWLLIERGLDEQLRWFLALTAVVGGLLALPLTGTTLAHAHSLRDQLQALGRITRRVVEQGDIRQIERLVSLRNDEAHELVADFNTMLDMFDELVDVATRVAAGDLRAELRRPGDLQDAFLNMVDRLRVVVAQLHTTAVDLNDLAAHIHVLTSKQNEATLHQASNIDAVADSVESLARSAERISATASLVLRDAVQTRDTTHDTITQIDDLRRHASGVRELLAQIREIADRSDLLALNGSLEAVRAGEAGRGFSLVATEMRRLAERVTLTINEVNERVLAIDSSGHATAEVAEASAGRAEQTASAAAAISRLTGEQSEVSERVANTVGEVANVLIAVGAASEQTQHLTEELKRHANTLEQLTGQFQLHK